jgi:hypothetical protein
MLVSSTERHHLVRRLLTGPAVMFDRIAVAAEMNPLPLGSERPLARVSAPRR